MARNYRCIGVLTLEDINETLMLIEGSDTDYITPTGRIFKKDTNGLFFQKKSYTNKHNGYVYVGITFHCFGSSSTNKNRRVHVLLAKAYLPNPDNLPVVGHKNNVKHDFRLDNLYWTTHKENSQKAHDDKLIINDIGIEDSQSCPIGVYSKEGYLLAVYGSISEAGRFIEGTSKYSIAKVVDNGAKHSIKGFLYRSISEDFYRENTDLQNLQLKTKYIKKVSSNIKVKTPEGEIYIFPSQKVLGTVLGIHQSTISQCINKSKDYYGYVFTRTEQEITTDKNENMSKVDFPERYNPVKVGDIFPTKNYGDVKVLTYINNLKVEVQFIDTGYVRWTSSQKLRKGCLSDNSLRGKV